MTAESCYLNDVAINEGLPLWPQLDDHQKNAVDFALPRLSCGLFFEQGTGKTWITIALIEQILTDTFQGYIVGPLTNLKTTWYATLGKLLPQINLTSDWNEYKKLPSPKLLVLHYEAFTKFTKYMKNRQWDFGCFDESQRLKDRGSLGSRRAKQMSEPTRRKLILSGTPDDGDPAHFWAQFRYFAPFVFGTNWDDFFTEYLRPTGFMGYKHKFKKNKIDQFKELMKPWSLYESGDVLGRPPLKMTRVWCTMKGKQREYYDQMETSLVIEELDVSAEFEMTKVGKLAQICGGHLIDGEFVYDVGRVKQRRAIKIIEREDKPCVVFCRYTEEIESLNKHLRRLGYRTATIQGKNKKSRDRVQRRFQRGDFDVLIAQIRTGGVGIDLYKSHVGIIYSSTYSRIDFDQAIKRLDRRGQTYPNPVRIYVLICRDSVDEEIITAIIDKRSVSKSVLKYLKRRRRTMAVKKPKRKAAPKKAAVKAEKKAPAESFKFGVSDLANALGIKPASARVRLRNAGIDKAGKSYGWNSQKDLDAVVKQLKSSDKEAA